MVSTTPVLKNTSLLAMRERLQRGLLLCWLCAFSIPALAADFRFNHVHSRLHEGVYLLDTDIEYHFTPEVLEALSNGVPITTQLSIEIQRERSWWPDQEIATLEQRYSLRYHALSHQYLLHNINSGAYYSYPSYPSALEAMGSIRDLPLLDNQLTEPDEHYLASMRVTLDIEALPSPLRPVAYITPAWRLRSEWYTWSLIP